MPIAIPNFSIRFVQHLAICGRVPLADMGAGFRIPEGAAFAKAEFPIAGDDQPGSALFALEEETERPSGSEHEESIIRFHVHFAKRAFFSEIAPAPNSTMERIGQWTDLLIGKRGRTTVSSRFVATEQDLQQASLIRPLLGLSYRSTERSLKLTGAEYEISPPPGALMSWSFREADRAVVTEIWARVSNPLEADTPQILLDQLASSFNAFVIGRT
jgi:hypothetical protein